MGGGIGVNAIREPTGGSFRRLRRFVDRWSGVAPAAHVPPPPPSPSPPPAPSAESVPSRSFAEAFGDQSWSQIFSDHTPVPFAAPGLDWLAAPPPPFVEHILGRRPLAFEAVPPDPARYLRPPTYSIVQMHRLWVTLREVERHLGGARLVLDLGAFPFSLDVLLREYLRYDGRIVATANLPVRDDWKAELERLRIEIAHLNLDEHVDDRADVGDLPPALDLADGSADLVILTHVIEHLYHPLGVLKEAFRVLRPGGRVLVSTDNAFMLDAFMRFAWLGPFLHEPVEDTSAMTFHFWRGHNRFFSEKDIETMLRGAGFDAIEGRFYEVLYNSFTDEYFPQPTTSLPKWRADVLTRIPGFRNEIVMVARKGERAD